jgi:hypothetical protein
MKQLILKIIVFVVLLYIPLYIIEKIVDGGMHKYRNGEYGVWNDIYDGKINADLIIVGNSRAFVNISPMILDSALHQSAYDLGVDGGDFNLAYTRFKVYLAHNKVPKTLVLSISTADFQRNVGMFQPQQYMPYLSDTVLRKGLTGYENSFNKADFYVPAMKYRTDPISYSIGFKLYFGRSLPNNDPRVNGYQARPRKWDDSFAKFKASHRTYTIKVDTNSVKEFYDLISICEKKQIKLYFVFSPEYSNVQPLFLNRDAIFAYYSDAAKQHKISFFDYSNDAMSRDTTYFYNSEHLNQHGAEVFTRKLAHDILDDK